MLKIDVDQATRTVLLEPEGHLAEAGFSVIGTEVDPLINESGDLNGVLGRRKDFSRVGIVLHCLLHIYNLSMGSTNM